MQKVVFGKFMTIDMGDNPPKQQWSEFKREPKEMKPVLVKPHNALDDAPSLFRVIENILVGCYDAGALTLAVLDSVGNTWRNYEMLPVVDEDDSGNNIMTNDGLYLSDIALELLEPGFSPESESHSWQRFVEVARERWGWR